MARRYTEKSRRSGKRIRVVDAEGAYSKNAATSLQASSWKNLPIAPSLDMLTVSGKTTGLRKLVFPYWEKHQKNLTVLGDESWRWLTVLIEKITQRGVPFLLIYP